MDDQAALSRLYPVTAQNIASFPGKQILATDANGFAAVSLQVDSIASGIQVSICDAPSNNPCQVFNAIVVPVSSLQLRPVAGTLQIVPSAQHFQPVTVRVTDLLSPPDPVLGAVVVFQSYVGRTPQNAPIIWAGEAGTSQSSMPVILAAPRATIQSAANGLASFPLSTAGISGDVAVVGSASLGNTSVQFAGHQLGP